MNPTRAPSDPASIPSEAPRARSAHTAIRLRGITKTFGSGEAAVPALRGVDMDVRAGQLVMLVGPSGCGKTTLVSIISGVLLQDQGSAEIFGTVFNSLSSRGQALARGRLVGFVFQQFNLIPALTAQENVAVPLLLRGVRRSAALARARAALDSVELASRAKSMPSQLSGGQQQRVAIARALVARPRLLVCDEPTANLDAHTGRTVMELIHKASRELDEEGAARCVLVVTHDNRVFHYADRIEEMEDGRIKSTPSEYVMEEFRHHHHDPSPAPSPAPAASADSDSDAASRQTPTSPSPNHRRNPPDNRSTPC